MYASKNTQNVASAPASIPVATNVNDVSNPFPPPVAKGAKSAQASFQAQASISAAPASIPVTAPVNSQPAIPAAVPHEHDDASSSVCNVDSVKAVLYRCLNGEKTQAALNNEQGVTREQFTMLKAQIVDRFNKEKEEKHVKLNCSNKALINCYGSVEGSQLMKRIIDELTEISAIKSRPQRNGVGVKSSKSTTHKGQDNPNRRSGGPRPNAGGARPNTGGPRRNSGGAREGSGSKLKNVLKLDRASYESQSASTRDLLICFHDAPNGTSESFIDTYAQLVKAFRSENVIIASIHAPSFQDITKKYGVQDLPAILIKYADSSKVARRMEKVATATVEDMVGFVNSCLGSYRLLDGSLTSQAGRVDEIDNIISSTSNSKVDENLVSSLKKYFDQVDEEPNILRAESITMYYQICNAAFRKGLEYIKEEHDRETEMLTKKHIRTPKKSTKHSIRLNILKVFKEHFNL